MKGIPVLMYHQVNYTKGQLSPEGFECQMNYLAKEGYHTIFIKEFDHFLKKDIQLPQKTVALTFDDGFLDSWIFVYPILKKYSLKATFFIVTARIKNRKAKCRPNLEDVWMGRCAREDLPYIDDSSKINTRCLLKYDGSEEFISWGEMRAMEDSGLIDIQSHTHLHSDAFVSEEIVDFNRNDPSQNYFFGTGWATGGDKRLGIPFYKRASSVAATIYYDDKKLRDFLADYVSKKPSSLNNNKELFSVVQDFRERIKILDSYESHTEREVRITKELLLSRKFIERNLQKKCSFICWPWGEYQDFSINYARKAGYLGAVTCDPGTNTRKTDLMKIKRIPYSRKLWKLKFQIFFYSNSVLGELGSTINIFFYMIRIFRFHLRKRTLLKTLRKRLKNRLSFLSNKNKANNTL